MSTQSALVGAVGGLVTVAAGLLGGLGPVWGFLVDTNGLWFGIIAVFSSQLVGIVPGVTQDMADGLLAGAAVVFVSIGLWQLARRARRRF